MRGGFPVEAASRSVGQERVQGLIEFDMRELGADSQKEHQRIVARLEQMQLQEVWLVGREFAATRHPFRSFANVEEVKQELALRPLSGRTILIKGSNGIRLQQLPELL